MKLPRIVGNMLHLEGKPGLMPHYSPVTRLRKMEEPTSSTSRIKEGVENAVKKKRGKRRYANHSRSQNSNKKTDGNSIQKMDEPLQKRKCPKPLKYSPWAPNRQKES